MQPPGSRACALKLQLTPAQSSEVSHLVHAMQVARYRFGLFSICYANCFTAYITAVAGWKNEETIHMCQTVLLT
jgi:hypothetical protein